MASDKKLKQAFANGSFKTYTEPWLSQGQSGAELEDQGCRELSCSVDTEKRNSRVLLFLKGIRAPGHIRVGGTGEKNDWMAVCVLMYF